MRVPSGDAARWRRIERVLLQGPGKEEEGFRPFEVEGARSYRDRLVLKLQGIDGSNDAEALKGCTVLVPRDQVPALGRNEHFAAELVGLEVVLEPTGEVLGAVRDLVATGGTDVLVVEEKNGQELLVPMAGEIVVSIELSERRIAVRLPPGLRALNATGNRS